jgi:hypothetical protein
MQARRAIWIAGGILALALVVAVVFVKPRHVSAQVLDETNGYRRVVVKNPTAHPYSVIAWGEFYANDAWERMSFSNTFLNVAPASSLEAGILMPTNTPKRIALVYRPIKQSGFGLWINKLRARLRLQSPVEREYIEVQ